MTRKIVIGWTDECMVDFLSELIADAYGEEEMPEIFCSECADELLAAARTGDTEMAIIVMNNIMFGRPLPWPRRFHRVIDLMMAFRSRHDVPIIALSGIYEVDLSVLQEAGVEFYYRLPFEYETIRAAVRAAARAGKGALVGV